MPVYLRTFFRLLSGWVHRPDLRIFGCGGCAVDSGKRQIDVDRVVRRLVDELELQGVE